MKRHKLVQLQYENLIPVFNLEFPSIIASFLSAGTFNLSSLWKRYRLLAEAAVSRAVSRACYRTGKKKGYSGQHPFSMACFLRPPLQGLVGR